MSITERLRRKNIPTSGERVAIYTNSKLTIQGMVTHADENFISITNGNMQTKNFNTEELSDGLADKSIEIRRVN